MMQKSAKQSSLRKKEGPDNLWLISSRLTSDFGSNNLFKNIVPDRIIAYKISDLAKYMINPNSIEIKCRLIGCKIIFQKAAPSKIRSLTEKYFSRLFKKNRSDIATEFHEETIISDYSPLVADVTDAAFQYHINKIRGLLTPYDSLNEKIAELDASELNDVLGIYRDPEGNPCLLRLHGSIPEKIEYILNHVHKKIGVLINKAHIDKGLFEMKGFNFEFFDPEKASWLIIGTRNDVSEAYVLGPDGSVEFKIEEIDLIRYLHFFQASLKTNSKLRNLINESVRGQIRLLKLFINRELEIDYFKTDLPKIYKEVFDSNAIPSDARKLIVSALNKKQIGIFMNYIYDSAEGKSRPSASMYVMHDIEALEAVKEILPYLYSQINQKLGDLTADKYYLMDTMKV